MKNMISKSLLAAMLALGTCMVAPTKTSAYPNCLESFCLTFPITYIDSVIVYAPIDCSPVWNETPSSKTCCGLCLLGTDCSSTGGGAHFVLTLGTNYCGPLVAGSFDALGDGPNHDYGNIDVPSGLRSYEFKVVGGCDAWGDVNITICPLGGTTCSTTPPPED